MKKILFISYAFPPTSGGGVLRILKFAKYLPDFDYEPHILTVKKAFYPIKDESLLKDIPPQVRITRINYFEPGFWLKARLWQSFLAYFWYPLILFPDQRILWFWPALRVGLKIIKQEKIKIIFSSSGPASNHLIAWALKKLTGVGWVADWRDEWAANPYLKFPTLWHRRLARWLERKLVNAADQIITVSSPLTNNLKKLAENKQKFSTITNGFDPEDFKCSKIPQKTKKFCEILYAGSLYGTRSAQSFLAALKVLQLKDLRITFIGSPRHLPHHEAIEKMLQADILLLIMSPVDTSAVITSKIFEYLAARKPILAISPSGTGAAQIIRKFKAGEIAEPQDQKAIQTAILKMYQKWLASRRSGQKNQLDVPEADLSPYDRRALTGKLAHVFDEISPTRISKKICLIVNSYSPQSAKLCQYLVKRGYEIHYVNLTNTPLRLPGVKNYWIRQEINPAWGLLKSAVAIFNKLRALQELKQIIKRVKPDIVHGHGLNFAGILAVYSGFHPTIVTTRGSDVMQIDKFIGAEQYLIRQTLKKADAVTGSSEALQNQSLRLGMPPEKFQMVYFGIDAEIFKKMPRDTLRRRLKIKNEKVIFCPRSINAIYNIDILIKAIARLKDNFKLMLIKQNLSPEYWAKIQGLIKELNLGKKIILWPQTDPQGMADLYNLAAVVVSLAQSDGLAVSFLEAMACEKKIVISNVGFVREWHQNNNFWVVPIGDIETTTKAIADALKMPSAKFIPIGKSNRQLVLDRAEINKGFEKIEEVYREAAK